MQGTENGNSIAKAIGCGKSGWIYRYIQNFNDSGYLIEKNAIFKDSIGRTNRRNQLSLQIKFFLDYAKLRCNRLEFDSNEIKWLTHKLDESRTLIIDDYFFEVNGSIIKSMLKIFVEYFTLMERKDNLLKNKFCRGILPKLWVMMLNQSYSPKIYFTMNELSKEIIDYHGQNNFIDDILNKYVSLNNNLLNLRTKEGKGFHKKLLARREGFKDLTSS
jgi:hypothetical protein